MGTRRGASAATTPSVPVVREVQLALVTSLTQAVVAELLRELRRVHQALVSPPQFSNSPPVLREPPKYFNPLQGSPIP